MIRRIGAAVVVLLVAAPIAWWVAGRPSKLKENDAQSKAVENQEALASEAGGTEHSDQDVQMTGEQQTAVGLRTAEVTAATSFDVLSAPGLVAPNESQYAFITPRAAGVVRSVNARIGQYVKAGELLATIDSAIIGEARLDLYSKLQALEIAKAEADWEEIVYKNTQDLIEHLRKGESPEQIQRRFQDRAVGENRERLLTAYAQYRLAQATIERNRELHTQKLITAKQFQEVTAGYEVAQATYQGLMDQMGYEAKLANTRASQAKHQAETAVRTAQERLRIFGVKPDGTEPEVEGGKVVGVKPDGSLVDPKTPVKTPDAIIQQQHARTQAAAGSGDVPPEAIPYSRETPVSTYSIWAPFDGTILDREMIVPGVAVDTSHRIFTMANLASVWIEASVHEGDFNLLAQSGREGKVRFRSPAYAGRIFEGEVIYSGDLVDEKSRTVKLLAKAENPDRMLKPGMFVEVEILNPRTEAAVQVPASALLVEGGRSFVFVKEGADRFSRHEVDAEVPRDGMVTIRRGLTLGQQVVVEGEFKLKALSVQLAIAGH